MQAMIKQVLLTLSVAVTLVFTTAAVAQEPTGLARVVRSELVMLPYYSVFDVLQFSVDGSKVTLEGQVSRPSLREDAERAVRRIDDVNEVDNQIEVLPVSPTDDRIRIAVFQAIYYHPTFSRYSIMAVPPIHIIVKNGDVRLVGTVNTQADKTIAGMQANGVAGVFSVTNDLVVGD